VLRAKGEAEAIQTVFGAIHDGNPTNDLLAVKYLEALRSIAATAESGNWDNARKSLKKLIQGQRAAES